MSEDHVSGQAENPRIGSTTIPDEFLNECPMSDGPIYACDHCRKNGTFDPSRYSFKPVSKKSNLSAGTEPGSVGADGKYIRASIPGDAVTATPSGMEWPSEMELRRIVEGWKENGRTSPNTKYARHPMVEASRNLSQTKFNPVDDAFQRGLFGKGRPGMENGR